MSVISMANVDESIFHIYAAKNKHATASSLLLLENLEVFDKISVTENLLEVSNIVKCLRPIFISKILNGRDLVFDLLDNIIIVLWLNDILRIIELDLLVFMIFVHVDKFRLSMVVINERRLLPNGLHFYLLLII